MYFKSRAEAGKLLADKLTHYRVENTAVLALSEGAALVGAEIAKRLHTNLLILQTENIFLPGELDAIAGQTAGNTLTYNNMFSPGQLEDYLSEFRQFIDAQRIEKFHKLNMMIGQSGEVKRDLIRHHVVIVVSDGVDNGFSLDIAADYLKQTAIQKLVAAVPVVNADAMDHLRLSTDELHLLTIADNYFGANHYYEENELPDFEGVQNIMRDIALKWQRA